MFLLLRRESLWIPVILLVILVGCWSELDLYAPSFPQMMHYFSTNEQMMQWTLSLNFLGFFFASLLCGPLADAYGRRPVVIGGSLIFMAGSFLCLCANSIELMLLGRLIQGIGVSAPVTICQAIIADIYEGERQVRILSRTNSVITITMALAPIFGVYLTSQFGWHSNFVVIFIIALLGGGLIYAFVPETHAPVHRKSLNLSGLMTGYKTLLLSRDFMASALGMCFAITPYFIMIGIMPLLFMEQLKVPLNQYAFYQGSIVGMFAVLSLGIPWILSRFNQEKVVFYSILGSVLSMSAAFGTSIFLPDNPLLITALTGLYTISIVVPPTLMFVRGMDMYKELKACASSLIQALRMLSMSIGAAVAGAFYNGTFKPVAVVMFLFMVLFIPLAVIVFRKPQMTPSPDTLPAFH